MTQCNNKPFETLHVSETDIDDLATPVDYFIGIRAVESATDGNTIYTPVRVPGEKVTPTGSLQNVVALDTNNSSLEIPEGQVLAGYYDLQPGGNIMQLADSTHAAQFLMISNYTSGKMLVQTTGFLTIPSGHSYIPLADYWLGDNGQPVTDDSITGQHLFLALDSHTLIVNIYNK